MSIQNAGIPDNQKCLLAKFSYEGEPAIQTASQILDPLQLQDLDSNFSSQRTLSFGTPLPLPSHLRLLRFFKRTPAIFWKLVRDIVRNTGEPIWTRSGVVSMTAKFLETTGGTDIVIIASRAVREMTVPNCESICKWLLIGLNWSWWYLLPLRTPSIADRRTAAMPELKRLHRVHAKIASSAPSLQLCVCPTGLVSLTVARRHPGLPIPVVLLVVLRDSIVGVSDFAFNLAVRFGLCDFVVVGDLFAANHYARTKLAKDGAGSNHTDIATLVATGKDVAVDEILLLLLVKQDFHVKPVALALNLECSYSVFPSALKITFLVDFGIALVILIDLHLIVDHVQGVPILVDDYGCRFCAITSSSTTPSLERCTRFRSFVGF
ncbi:hypothetical protein KC335_g172 [Hortaea werneckii]|nr:hypothetical protein KC335_g172 [Hortaea werneckii]